MWLTSTPLERYHFDLSPNEFKDGLAIRYLWHPADLPACCDGCEADFTLQCGMDCKKRGVVIQWHNEVRDCLGDISSEVWPSVIKEPIVRKADPSSNDVGLRLDLEVRGVWSPQTEAFFDIRIIDTDAPSYKHRTPEAVLKVQQKKRKGFIRKLLKIDVVNLHPLLFQWMDSCTERQTILAASLATIVLLRNSYFCQKKKKAIFCKLEIC